MQASQFTAQNRRYYQEDRSFVKKLKDGGMLLGVFDGHGGAWASEYASKHTPFLFRAISKNLKDPEEILKQVIARLNKKTCDYTCGSTANIVWISDNTAHVAVLGDSITLIRSMDGSIWQSPEHNVRTNEAEAIAAEARGGRFDGNYLFDKWRIDGPGLQMSRALGDRDLDRVLNREPEIFHIPLNNDSWILLCSDGLIDPSHKSTDTIPMIINFIDHGADAEELVLAMSNIQNDDNSTAILVRMS